MRLLQVEQLLLLSSFCLRAQGRSGTGRAGTEDEATGGERSHGSWRAGGAGEQESRRVGVEPESRRAVELGELGELAWQGERSLGSRKFAISGRSCRCREAFMENFSSRHAGSGCRTSSLGWGRGGLRGEGSRAEGKRIRGGERHVTLLDIRERCRDDDEALVLQQSWGTPGEDGELEQVGLENLAMGRKTSWY